jgi:hypothetical protein
MSSSTFQSCERADGVSAARAADDKTQGQQQNARPQHQRRRPAPVVAVQCGGLHAPALRLAACGADCTSSSRLPSQSLTPHSVPQSCSTSTRRLAGRRLQGHVPLLDVVDQQAAGKVLRRHVGAALPELHRHRFAREHGDDAGHAVLYGKPPVVAVERQRLPQAGTVQHGRRARAEDFGHTGLCGFIHGLAHALAFRLAWCSSATACGRRGPKPIR